MIYFTKLIGFFRRKKVPNATLEIQTLHPEWKVWAKCPENKCDSVVHACCRRHLREELATHTDEKHDPDLGILGYVPEDTL